MEGEELARQGPMTAARQGRRRDAGSNERGGGGHSPQGDLAGGAGGVATVAEQERGVATTEKGKRKA